MRVAVVGAGYSGTMAAVEAKRACPAAEVSLVEKRGRFAAGAAYGTARLAHLLNARARSMSAFADAPDDFAAWLAREGLGGPETFARRRDYARYLAEVLGRSRGDTRPAGGGGGRGGSDRRRRRRAGARIRRAAGLRCLGAGGGQLPGAN